MFAGASSFNQDETRTDIGRTCSKEGPTGHVHRRAHEKDDANNGPASSCSAPTPDAPVEKNNFVRRMFSRSTSKISRNKLAPC